MKRYMMFAGYYYYPSGGMKDYVGSFDTFEECEALWKEKKFERASGFDWGHVYDTQEDKTIDLS